MQERFPANFVLNNCCYIEKSLRSELHLQFAEGDRIMVEIAGQLLIYLSESSI